MIKKILNIFTKVIFFCLFLTGTWKNNQFKREKSEFQNVHNVSLRDFIKFLKRNLLWGS